MDDVVVVGCHHQGMYSGISPGLSPGSVGADDLGRRCVRPGGVPPARCSHRNACLFGVEHVVGGYVRQAVRVFLLEPSSRDHVLGATSLAQPPRRKLPGATLTLRGWYGGE